MSVHPPEMEVQTCGENCKDCELETVGGRTFRVLLVRIRSRTWRCILMQHVAVGVLRRETSAARSGKEFWEIHTPGGTAMPRCSLPRSLQDRD